VLHWQRAVPCNAADMRALVAHYVPDIEIAGDLLAAILTATHGSARRIVNNLERVREFCAERNLKKVDAASWGATPIDNGRPPPPRAGGKP
jgi:hypothetical protein